MEVVKKCGEVSVKASADTIKDVFAELARMEEVFGNDHCGKCKGTSLRFVVRNVDDNDFYELRCSNPKCRAKLSFGANKKGGGLFPKIKDEKGDYLNDRGWLRWNKEKGVNE